MNNQAKCVTATEALELFIAALNKVDERYYKVTLSSDIPVEIERVFCYELYHQFRICLTDDVVSENGDALDFHGELRKNNDTKLNGKVPDMLLHHSGNDESNMLCVEVKTGADLGKSDICKDIDKLSNLCKEHKYESAVYLLVLTNKNSLQKVKERIRELQPQNGDGDFLSRMFIVSKEQGKSAEMTSFKAFAER